MSLTHKKPHETFRQKFSRSHHQSATLIPRTLLVASVCIAAYAEDICCHLRLIDCYTPACILEWNENIAFPERIFVFHLSLREAFRMFCDLSSNTQRRWWCISQASAAEVRSSLAIIPSRLLHNNLYTRLDDPSIDSKIPCTPISQSGADITNMQSKLGNYRRDLPRAAGGELT